MKCSWNSLFTSCCICEVNVYINGYLFCMEFSSCLLFYPAPGLLWISRTLLLFFSKALCVLLFALYTLRLCVFLFYSVNKISRRARIIESSSRLLEWRENSIVFFLFLTKSILFCNWMLPLFVLVSALRALWSLTGSSPHCPTNCSCKKKGEREREKERK